MLIYRFHNLTGIDDGTPGSPVAAHGWAAISASPELHCS